MAWIFFLSFPNIRIVNRQCMQECTVNGIQIPEGMIIQTNSMVMHYDPELWGPTDPSIFDPER